MGATMLDSLSFRRSQHHIVRERCCRGGGRCFLGRPRRGPGVLTVVAPPDVDRRFLELVATICRNLDLDPVVLGIVRGHPVDESIFPDVIDASGAAALAFRLLDLTGLRSGWDVQRGDTAAAAIATYVSAWHPDAVAMAHRPHRRLSLCPPVHVAGRLDVPLLVA